MNINPCPHKEKDYGTEHAQSWYGKTNLPANRVLHIDNHCLSDQQHHCECGVVPIKEAVDPFLPFICCGVELIHTKWYAAWPYTCREPIILKT